jgi:HEAT repeat protein
VSARQHRIARILQLRSGEGRPVALAVAASAIASAGLMIGQSGIEALFFARYGVEKLPQMYLVLGATMFLATIGFSALLGRVGRGRACLLIPVALAVVVAAGRIALAADLSWITPVLWVVQGVAYFLVGLSVWGLAGIVTDTRQAKRFFPLIGAGGVLGFVVGGLVTKPLASAFGTPNLLLVWLVTLVAVAAIGAALVATGGPEPRRSSGDRHGAVDQLQRGLRYVRSSRLMRWLALASVLFSLLFFSLYLPFSRAATARYPDPDELAGFFGLFFGISTGVAFLIAAFVTNRLLARFGVPTVMLVLPVLYVVAFGVLAIQAGFTALAVFRFVQVAWLQGGATSSWEACINTVPAERRDQTRAFLYGGPTQVGTVLAGIVALVGERAFSPSTLYVVGFVAAVLATVAMVGVRRAYPLELVQALREGRPNVFAVDPDVAEPFGLARADTSAATVALAALSDHDVRVRRVAAHVAGDLDTADAFEALTAATRDDDGEVRATALRSLARSGGAPPPDLLEDRSADPVPDVRIAVVEVVEGLGAMDRATSPLEALVGDPDPYVRVRATAALVRRAADPDARAALTQLATDDDADVRAAAFRAMRGLEDPDLFEVTSDGMRDEAPGVRAEAARAIGSVDPPRAIDELIAAMDDEQPIVRAGVADGLGSFGIATIDVIVASLTDPTRRDTALAALERMPPGARPDDVRRFAEEMVGDAVENHRLGSALDGTGDGALEVLADSLLDRSRREAITALRATAVLGGGSAMTVALDSLSVTDPAQRANALELIESVGERAIVRPLLAIWDGTAPPADARAVLAQLTNDPDGWIRAWAERAARGPGGPMTRTMTTLDPMDRVLFLRKVPLFAELPPPDLQPIAEIAEEHAYADGDTIVRQGDVGDAMHIIVDGAVSVVVEDEHGTRTVAHRSTGDVVGEMALITHEPRIASLVAEGNVRVLSIGRPQFESILRERPETALAVMRELCRRLAEAAPSVSG